MQAIILHHLQENVNMNNMHEKLREFERASGLEIYGLGARRIPWEHAMERFSELIVRECMSNLHLHGYDDAMNQIKEHFGIEQ